MYFALHIACSSSIPPSYVPAWLCTHPLALIFSELYLLTLTYLHVVCTDMLDYFYPSNRKSAGESSEEVADVDVPK